MHALFSSMRSNPIEADRSMATLQGTIAPAAFFAPENMARMMNGPK
jgi:hypothetical protein